MNGAQKLIKIFAVGLAVVIIFNICSWIITGVSFLLAVDIFNDNNKTEKTMTFDEVYENVKEVEIDLVSAYVVIESGSEFRVSANEIDSKVNIKYKNGALEIEEKDNIFNINKSEGTIFITIPELEELDKLSIDSGAGKFVIKNIQVKEFDIDHGAGIMEISNSSFKSIDIDGGAGSIKINSSLLNNLDLDAGVGSIDIEADITGNSKISCGVGDVKVKLLGTSNDYSIKTEKGVGSIKIAGQDAKNDVIYGNGSNKIELEGGIGSIKVEFKGI